MPCPGSLLLSPSRPLLQIPASSLATELPIQIPFPLSSGLP